MHNLDAYENGVQCLLGRLGPDHHRYAEALTLQSRLSENIANTWQFGNDETHRANRAQIVEALNRLALETVAVSLNELCERRDPAASAPETEDVRGLLEAMGHRTVVSTDEVGHELTPQLHAMFESGCDDGCPVCRILTTRVVPASFTPIFTFMSTAYTWILRLQRPRLCGVTTGQGASVYRHLAVQRGVRGLHLKARDVESDVFMEEM